jgi:hypothetical protein
MEHIAKGKPKQNYSWYLVDGKADCFVSPDDDQTVTTKLWEVFEPQQFHDQALMEATAKINAILEKTAQKPPHRERELCFIEVENRLLLVWSKTHHGLIAQDDPQAVADALGIRHDRV